MIQSVERAIKLLQEVAGEGDWVGVRELARRTGLTPPTAQNLLKTLQYLGFLEFDEKNRRYRLGMAVLRLAEAVDPIRRLGDFVRPYVDEMLAEFSETVAVLTMLQGSAVVVDWRMGVQPLSVHEPRRIIEQIHHMASGQVLLAYAEEWELNRYLESVFQPNQGRNIPATPEELRAALVRVTAQGYAETADAGDSGIAALSAPVFDALGKVTCAIACSAPLSRFDAPRRETVRLRLLEISRRMTSALGAKTADMERVPSFARPDNPVCRPQYRELAIHI